MDFTSILTERQQEQFIAFVVNFLSLLHENTTASYETAEILLNMAISTLLGAVFEVLPLDGSAEPDEFILGTMKAALKREFASKVKVVD